MEKMATRVLFIMALAMALATSQAWAVTPEEEKERSTIASSFHDASYSPGPYHPYNKTCDKYPRECRAAGSPGPDCCGKKCVNVDTDKLNCGKCGCRCKYGQTCCGGKCVDVTHDCNNCGKCGNRCRFGWQCCRGKCVDVKNDPNNCGACNHKCKKGVLCKYGICGYGY